MTHEPLILLTGVTGFVGKVVLEELFRLRQQRPFARVAVLIRPKKDRTAQERFEQDLLPSECFQHLPADWQRDVWVLDGDLAQPQLGIDDENYAELSTQLTHIINCAASVEFDLPLAEAAEANITSALNVLELAQACPQLRRFVNVSTAYVTPHPGEGQPIPEQLVSLPFSAQEIYQQICAGRADEKALLAQTGHPNTYTFTKCLSENILSERKGNVPLTILRPSIISASWQHPQPGWIDSHAAFAGFVALIGAGLLKAVSADDNTVLDIVPCDEVAHRILDSCFQPASPPLVEHIVSGLDHGCRVDTSIAGIESYFRRHPVKAWPELRFVSNGRKVGLQHFRHHALPVQLANLWFSAVGNTRQKRRAGKLLDKIAYLNRAFPYFTHNSFNFQSRQGLHSPHFEPKAYIECVCRGVHAHLMQQNPREMMLGGRKHNFPRADRVWARQQSEGNWAIRSAAYMVRKGFRKGCSHISFDRESFEKSVAQIDPHSLIVLVPNHRSYMDFVVCSYLFFAHPELNIAIPQIAAAHDFAKLPFLGWFFQQTYAFYIKRGQGKEDPELSAQIQRLVDNRQTLEFFIEGTRSRSRQFVQPRRGLLRALQNTGVPCTLLPISISYDRVPEESAFLKELDGGAKPKMRMGPLLKWSRQLASGQIDIGRVHLACGEAVHMHQDSDVYAVSRQIMAELQAKTVVSAFHLRQFLSQHPQLSLDYEGLKALIQARGGQVIDSPLTESSLPSTTEMTLRYQWKHLFYADLQAHWPNHPAIETHLRQNAYGPLPRPQSGADEAALAQLLDLLFNPLFQAYSALSASLANPQNRILAQPKHILARHPGLFLPYLEEALEEFLAQEILLCEDNLLRQGPQWQKHAAYGVQARSLVMSS